MSRGLSRHETAAVRGPSATTPSTLRCLSVWTALTLALGAVAWLCTAALLDTATAPAGEGVVAEQSVVLVACVAGTCASLHVWVLASLTVLDTLRGRALPTPVTDQTGRPGGAAGAHTGCVRRLTLVACGVAVSAGAAMPAYAAEQTPGATTSELAVLDGLPYPDRATTRARATTPGDVVVHHDMPAEPSARVTPPTWQPPRAAPAPSTQAAPGSATARTVRAGDSLWAIAADLTGDAEASTVARRVDELHGLNRSVIGHDPDVIHPGQRLRVEPAREPFLPTHPSSTDQPRTTDRSQEGSR